MIDLKALAGQNYRLTLDPSAEADPTRAERPWLYRVPAKYGFIGVHGGDALVAYCDRPRLFSALLEIPGARTRQRGDTEIAVLIGPEHLDRAAGILKARRRRRLSPEARERATARLAANRFGSHSDARDAAPCCSRA
jgi:hypothetical protein